MIKRKHQEIFLENVEPFEKPKRSLEQYMTQPKDASQILYKIYELGDFENKTILDLGAGTGMYSFGASYLGASKIFSLEIDEDAIQILKSSIDEAELDEKIEVIQWDVYKKDESTIEKQKENNVETVITNPPFGASKNEGIDIEFIDFADKICKGGNIYSIHKTSTRGYLEKHADILGRHFEVQYEFDFEIPFTDFEKEDLKNWSKNNQQQKKNNKGHKPKLQQHKKEIDYCKCDLILWKLKK